MNEETGMQRAADVMEAVRDGSITPKTCRQWNTMPQVTELRKEVAATDSEALARLLNSQDADVCRLGVAMMGALSPQQAPAAWQALKNLWLRPESPFNLRIALQFRLLDDRDIGVEWQRDLLEFTLQRLAEWRGALTDWIGDPKEVVAYCTGRLSDPSVPPTKLWTYLCLAAAYVSRDEFDSFSRKVLARQSGSQRDFTEDALGKIRGEGGC